MIRSPLALSWPGVVLVAVLIFAALVALSIEERDVALLLLGLAGGEALLPKPLRAKTIDEMAGER